MSDERSISVEAPGKINLGLHVLRKRSDGYHDLETVFVAIEWADQIELRDSVCIQMRCSDPELPTDDQNLCVKAARLLAQRTGCPHGASIFLDKRLPWGAGLGSGSSDAASTLNGLCKLWDLSVSQDELLSMAASLGSDVPFFVDPRPALGTGRGEKLSYLEDSRSGATFSLPYTILVVSSPIHISSKEAYKEVKPNGSRRFDLAHLVLTGDMHEWRRYLVNDFEPVVFRAYPALAELKKELYSLGAYYVSLSGSGSAMFALFSSELAAAKALTETGATGWIGRVKT